MNKILYKIAQWDWYRKATIFFVSIVILITGLGSHIELGICCPSPGGIIKGTVTDAITGIPIEGALIVVNNNKFSTSQKDGSYYSWNYVWQNNLKIYASGYENRSVTITVIKHGENIEDFTLTPGISTTAPPKTGSLKGTIIDKNTGDPVSGTNNSFG